jgi:DNA-binding MarR family transcriptional regulator
MDLSYNQYKTLLTVADRGEGSLGDLARDLGVAMSSASQMVDRLVGEGWIHREQDAGNRRQIIIRLTPEGEALIGELQRGILAEYRQILQRLPEKEQEELVQAFEAIARILGKLT